MVVTLRTVKKKKVRKMKTMNKNHRLNSTPIDILQNVRPSKSVTVRLPAPPHLSGIFFCSPSNSFFFVFFSLPTYIKKQIFTCFVSEYYKCLSFHKKQIKKTVVVLFSPPQKKKKKKKKK